MSITVREGNEIAIPIELASELGITAGTQLEVAAQESEGTLILKVVPDRTALIRSLQGAGRKYLNPGENPIKELIEERVREDAEREATL